MNAATHLNPLWRFTMSDFLVTIKVDWPMTMSLSK